MYKLLFLALILITSTTSSIRILEKTSITNESNLKSVFDSQIYIHVVDIYGKVQDSLKKSKITNDLKDLFLNNISMSKLQVYN